MDISLVLSRAVASSWMALKAHRDMHKHARERLEYHMRLQQQQQQQQVKEEEQQQQEKEEARLRPRREGALRDTEGWTSADVVVSDGEIAGGWMHGGG